MNSKHILALAVLVAVAYYAAEKAHRTHQAARELLDTYGRPANRHDVLTRTRPKNPLLRAHAAAVKAAAADGGTVSGAELPYLDEDSGALAEDPYRPELAAGGAYAVRGMPSPFIPAGDNPNARRFQGRSV